MLLPLRHVVIATGGGTFADPDNRAAINLDGVSVWVDVPLAGSDPPDPARRPAPACRRPRRAGASAPVRAESYRLAHIRVNGARASVAAIAECILEALDELPPRLTR